MSGPHRRSYHQGGHDDWSQPAAGRSRSSCSRLSSPTRGSQQRSHQLRLQAQVRAPLLLPLLFFNLLGHLPTTSHAMALVTTDPRATREAPDTLPGEEWRRLERATRRLSSSAELESSLPFAGLALTWPLPSDGSRPAGMVLLEEIPAATTTVKASKVGALSAANVATNSSAAGAQMPVPVVAPRTGLHQWLHAMKLMLSFSFVLKCLCIGSNVLYQVSPLPTAQQFQKDGDTGEVDSAPLVSIAFSCSQFFFYGSFAYWATGKSGFLVLVYSNAVGLALGYYYIYAFLSHCRDKHMAGTTWTYLRCITSLLIGQFAFTYILPPGRALLMVGLISSTCTLISACSLVTTVPDVIRKRCSRSLPVPILLCGEVSGVLWLLCGYMLGDLYIILPNIVCVIISSFALSLAWYFPREVDDVDFGRFATSPQDQDEVEAPRDYGSMVYASSHHWAGSGSDHSPSPIARPGARRCNSSPHVCCAGTGEADGETGGTPSPPPNRPLRPDLLGAYA